ncbi:hypothetical protein [Absidia glauca]|uniref:Nbr1 FW domain-containing protein n=1 Tax=Absidia glauca TaxID=4829 RepID=A0A168L8G8_ABSGL|nr:hypothetical protein [Absidia glauca]
MIIKVALENSNAYHMFEIFHRKTSLNDLQAKIRDRLDLGTTCFYLLYTDHLNDTVVVSSITQLTHDSTSGYWHVHPDEYSKNVILRLGKSDKLPITEKPLDSILSSTEAPQNISVTNFVSSLRGMLDQLGKNIGHHTDDKMRSVIETSHQDLNNFMRRYDGDQGASMNGNHPFHPHHSSIETPPQVPRSSDLSAELMNETGSLIIMRPSQRFTMTWQLQNNGQAQWPTGSTLVSWWGDERRTFASSCMLLPVPGQKVSFKAEQLAPNTPGLHSATLCLVSPEGMLLQRRLEGILYVALPTSDGGQDGDSSSDNVESSASDGDKYVSCASHTVPSLSGSEYIPSDDSDLSNRSRLVAKTVRR